MSELSVQIQEENVFPDAAPVGRSKPLEELKDEAGAWTLASDESVKNA